MLGTLVRAAQACYDVASVYRVPFISGKDSLNNEFVHGDETIQIPPTLLISAIGLIDDVRRCGSMDLKTPRHALVLAGLTRDELGASHLYLLRGEIGANVPVVDAKANKRTFHALHAAILAGRVRTGDTAWFAGFAPHGRPRVAFAVCAEYLEGGGGRNAGPIALEIVRICREMGYLK